jgi:hypothetical protein
MSKLERRPRYLNWLTALLLLAPVIGCGGGSGRPAVFAPTVTPVAPVQNAIDVPVNTKTITAAFVKAMDAATLTTANFTLACPAGTPVIGTISYLTISKVVTLTLPATSNLPPSTRCVATMTTGAKDTAGIRLASNFQWAFTTGLSLDTTAPTVSSPVPLANAAGVPVNTAVTVIFSEAMDPLTITPASFSLACPTGTGTAVTGTVVYGVAGNVATFTPTPGSLPNNTPCTATITTDVKDVAGNALASTFSWTFSTALDVSFCEQGFTQTDHYIATSSINGQNGWTSSGGFDEQVRYLGSAAQAGSNVWNLSNRISSGTYGNQPLSPQLSESAGESTVRSAGGGDAMEVVFWVRPLSSSADGSAITLSLSPTGGDRQTYLRIENNLDANGGNQIRVIDYLGVAHTNDYRTFVTATEISRTAWTKVRMSMETPDGGSNDVFQVFLNDQLAGTYSTWEDYHTWSLGGNAVTEAANRLMFRVSVPPSAIDASFADTDAQGFVFDNLCYRVYNRSTPSNTIQFYRTGFES